MRGSIYGVAVSLGIAACSPTPAGQSAAAAADPGPPPTSPTPLRVVARDFAFDSGHTVPAGLIAVRLVNQGHAMHMMGIDRLDSNHTIADVYRDLNNPKATLDYFKQLGGPGAVSPGDSSTQYVVLEPGNYALICWWPDSTGKDHVMSGMMATLTVTGDSVGAPVEPHPDIYVRERDYHIATAGAWTAGHHVIRVDNDGPNPHDVTILRVLPGKPDAEVEKWLLKPTMNGAPVEALGGTVAIERYGHTEISADLTPGNYLLLCMVGDRPHFTLGMVTKITVN
jgi:hypothetical protein